MSTNLRASPTDKHYSHHIVLTDDYGNSIGINAVNPRGEPDIRSIRRVPYPKNSISVDGGAGVWSKRRPPFGQEIKSAWYGGMGQQDGEADKTKYWFGEGIWSASPNGLMLAPAVFHCELPWPYTVKNMPKKGDTVGTILMRGSDQYLAVRVTTTATINCTGIRVKMRTTAYTAKAFSAALFSHNASPNEPLAALVTSSSTVHLIAEHEREFLFTSTYSLVAGTYWVVIYMADVSGLDASDGVNVRTVANSALTQKRSADGATWAASTDSPFCFALLTNMLMVEAKFFQYRWGLYCFMQQGSPADGTVKLFLNGDRGVCADNAADKTKLNDNAGTGSAKTWTTNQWVGAYVRIYSNPGSGEWRKITANTATTLTVDHAWDTTHTTASTYIIIGSKFWTEVLTRPGASTHGLTYVEDVCVSKEGVVYFAQGDTRAIRRMREYNNSGTYTREFADDVTGASRLLSAFDQVKNAVVWRAINGGEGKVSMAPATAWGTNLTFDTGKSIAGLEQDINGLVEADQKIYVVKMDAIWVISPDGKPAKIIDWPMLWNRNSGKNPALFPPYIVFPVRNGLERLYNNLMEDFGVNRDDGLPKRYSGQIADIRAINGMGGLLVGINPGTELQRAYQHVGEAGVYVYRNGGWHPVGHLGYGEGLYALGWQDIDEGLYYLYTATRQGIFMQQFPGEWDYRMDGKFYGTGGVTPPLTGEGVVYFGRTNGGFNTIEKWWQQLTVYGEDLKTTNTSVRLYARTTEPTQPDSANNMMDVWPLWTYLGSTDAVNEYSIPIEMQSRELWLMAVLVGDGSHTPVVKALSDEYLARMDDADSWTFSFRVSDVGYDRNGRMEARGAQAALEQIETWSRKIRPLTMTSVSPIAHNKKVLVQRPGVQVLNLEPDVDAAQGREIDYVTITLLEANCEIVYPALELASRASY